MKVVDSYKQNFVESIISISYFRIPQFRRKFLDIILEKGNMVIEEWRATDGITLEVTPEEDDANENNPTISRMFDWKTFFYD